MRRIAALLTLLALAFASPTSALDIRSSAVAGRGSPAGNPLCADPKNIEFNRADRTLTICDPSNNPSVTTLLKALPAGRRAVEQGQSDDQTVAGVPLNSVIARSGGKTTLTPDAITIGGDGSTGPVDLMSTKVPSAGAVARSLTNRFLDFGVTPEDFGAVGDGVADDSAAFNAATTRLAALGGGTVRFRKQYRFVSGDLFIPSNVPVMGASCTAGGKRFGNVYTSLPSTIILDPARKIFGGESAFFGCAVVKRDGLTQPASTRDQLDMVRSFAGQGIVAGGSDFTVKDVLVLGFDTCYYSSGYQRPVVQNFQGDCTNGIVIDHAHDVAKVAHAEMYPYLTTESYNSPTFAVTAAANNGSGLWRVTTASPHGFLTGDVIWIANGTTARGINGRWTITKVDDTRIDLQGSTFAPPGATADTVSGRAYVENVSATAGLRIGMSVSGAGIPGGTTIANIWNNRVYLSAAATATATGAALTFTDSAYAASGATLYVHTNFRFGAAFRVTNSETPHFSNIFDYGHEICFHSGTMMVWATVINLSCDNYRDPADTASVGILIDGVNSGSIFQGGSIQNSGVSLRVNTTAYNGNQTAHTFTGLVMDPPSGGSFKQVPPLMDIQRGRVVFQGGAQNAAVSGNLLAGSAAGIDSLLLTGNDLAATSFLPWSPADAQKTVVTATLGQKLPGRSVVSVNKGGVAQSVPTGTNTQVTLGTVDINQQGAFDTTGSAWTPTAGTYRIAAQVFFGAGLTSAADMLCVLRKNGVAFAASKIAPESGAYATCAVSGLASATGADVFTLWVFNGSAGDVSIDASAPRTFLNGSPI